MPRVFPCTQKVKRSSYQGLGRGGGGEYGRAIIYAGPLPEDQCNGACRIRVLQGGKQRTHDTPVAKLGMFIRRSRSRHYRKGAIIMACK